MSEFEEPEDIAGSGEDTAEAEEMIDEGSADVELEEVDTPEETEQDEVEGGTEGEKPKAAKKATKKANARPPVPEGYIAPVAFAKVLTAKLVADGKLAADEEIPPQMIYSYIKNTAKSKDPLPVYEAGGRSNLLKEEEAFAWWARKEERAAERKANKGKKAEKAAASEVAEAEGDEATPDAETVDVE